MRPSQRTQAAAREGRGKLRKPGQLAHQPHRRRLQQRLPTGHVVGQPRHGLQFVGLQGRAGNARLGGQLRGIKEAADRNGNLVAEQQPQFASQLMLARDPLFVGRGL